MSGWVAVVPVKELAVAKSRLGHLPPTDRADLALAMAGDVVTAALASDGIVAVVVVTNDARAAETLSELGALVVPDAADAGLDPALTDGARAARGWHPAAGVAALSGDLPCLRAGELAVALSAAAGHARAVVADRRGSGTTLLTAGPGLALLPQYGGGSLAAHRSTGAVELAAPAYPSLRLDVDTADDLADAVALGVGAYTSAVLDQIEARARG